MMVVATTTRLLACVTVAVISSVAVARTVDCDSVRL